MTDIKTFKGPSGRMISFNASLELPVLLEDVSSLDIQSAIAEYESRRIREYWNEKLLLHSKEGPWLRAFDVYRKTNKSHRPVPAIFRTRTLQRLLGCDGHGEDLSLILQAGSLEKQRSQALALMPATRTDMADIMRWPDGIFDIDFYAMLAECGSAAAFVQRLCVSLRKNEDAETLIRYMEFLTLLWSQGMFLFPQDVRRWRVMLKWKPVLNPAYAGERLSLAIGTKAMLIRAAPSFEFSANVYTFYATTDIRTAADLSPEVIAAYENLLFDAIGSGARTVALSKVGLSKARFEVRRVGDILLQYFNAQNPKSAVPLPTRVKHKDPLTVRTDGLFRWLASARPLLKSWVTLFRNYVNQLTGVTTEGPIGCLNRFGDYLCWLPNPPLEVWEVSRAEHIYDATRRNKTTFCEYLRMLNVSDMHRTHSLFRIKHFFDWYADYLVASHSDQAQSFVNPVRETDSFGSVRNRGQTHRNALPAFVLNEMKDVLTADDFAFPRSCSRSSTRVVDAKTGKAVKVWYPGLAVCLYLMLETPVRSHQARWLDSGLLDEMMYDRASNATVRNPSPHAIPGRSEGALRLQRDSLRSEGWLGLRINTNKTAHYDSDKVGFVIPYVSERLATLLTTMIEWQIRHMPPMAAPIPYENHNRGLKQRAQVLEKLPQVAPLFRDPCNPQNLPIRYHRLAGFYSLVLAETQKRIKEKHGHDIQLVTTDESGNVHWAVDLHTLRVSGITSMIESGVPLEVVSQFVAGHATLVMTLHYLKYSPLKLREFLAEAHEKMLANTDFVGSEVFSANLDQFAPFMLSQAGAGTGPGFSSLQEKTGIVTITSEGICPGTSCSTGGPAVDVVNNQYGPVPGGRRCGLCRYWITGPAHLLGQVAAVNNLAYAIRKKGLEIADLNDQRLDAEDQGNHSKARQLRDRVDILNLELGIDVSEWAARYQYASQSVTLLNKYLAAKAQAEGLSLPVPLLTASTPHELRVTLEEAHEFALLDQITQMSSFVTGFKNREAELEKNAVLSQMMASNGLKPLLLGLSEAEAHEAGNLLSSVLLQQVRSQELGDVLSGTRPVSNYPRLAQTIESLAVAVDRNPQVGDRDWKNLATLLSRGNGNANEKHVEEDEEERRFA